MPKQNRYKPSPVAAAMRLVHQITSISFELVIPSGLGYWLDTRWGTSPWLLVLGAVFGFGIAGTHLKQFVVSLEKSQSSKQRRDTANEQRAPAEPAKETGQGSDSQTPSSK